MTAPLLEVHNLRTYFYSEAGVHRAVDGVDLTVHEGRTLCVVGESGSGKSVTALSVLGLVDEPGRIEPGSEIRLEGRDITQLRERAWRKVRGRDIAMIFQEPMTALDPVHTIGSQIAEVIRTHEEVSRRNVRTRVLELMDLVGIASPSQRADDYPHQLSGGMRQRVMIAAALACSPKLLIADEPTTALDVTIQAQILDLMRSLQEQLRMAILMITHDVGVVAEMADDVAVMYAGKVVEVGGAREVIKDPTHPYTEALLRSVPTLGMDRSQRLASIRGMVPSALRWPHGCRFFDRCDLAESRCQVHEPRLDDVAGRQVACLVRGSAVAGDSEGVLR